MKIIENPNRGSMGLMRAAGKLGLGLAAVTVRRCSSFAAAVRMQSDKRRKKPKENKCLYLCFRDLQGPSSRDMKQVIRPIPWNSTDGNKGETEMLVDAVHWTSDIYNMYIFKVCNFGSLILFPSAIHSLDVCWVDTSKTPLDFQIFPNDKPVATKLKDYHHNLKLGVVDGKLYRINNFVDKCKMDPEYCSFQVYNPKKTESGAWLPLPNPPFTQFQHSNYKVIFLDAVKKIVGWGVDDRQLWFFDTIKPEIGWNYINLGYSQVDFPVFDLAHDPLFVLDHHREFGDFYFMFNYHPETVSISAHIISSDFKRHYNPVYTQIKLRELCSKSDLSEYIYLYKRYGVDDHEFVHLGGQRVALVLHKYVNKNGGEKPGSILVVAFEYEITTTEMPIKIQTRLIKTRRFKCLHSSQTSGSTKAVL